MPLSTGDFGMTASKVYSRAPGSLSQNTTDYNAGLPREGVGTFWQIHQVCSILTDLKHPASECSTSVINDFELFLTHRYLLHLLKTQLQAPDSAVAELSLELSTDEESVLAYVGGYMLGH